MFAGNPLVTSGFWTSDVDGVLNGTNPGAEFKPLPVSERQSGTAALADVLFSDGPSHTTVDDVEVRPISSPVIIVVGVAVCCEGVSCSHPFVVCLLFFLTTG